MHERISRIRHEEKLSQEEFGARLDITQTYVWMIESGKRVPSERLFKSICREFGVNEHWLRTGEGEMRRPSVSDTVEEIAQSNDLGEEDRETLSEFIKLPLESQKVLIDYLRNTLERMDKLMASKLAEEQQESEPPPKPQKFPTREQEAAKVAGQIYETILSGGEKAPESGTPPDGVGIA